MCEQMRWEFQNEKKNTFEKWLIKSLQFWTKKKQTQRNVTILLFPKRGVRIYMCVCMSICAKKFDCINRKKEIYSTFQEQKQKKIKTNEKLNRINDDTDVRVRVCVCEGEWTSNHWTITQFKRRDCHLFCLRFFKKKTTCTNTNQALSTFRKKNIQRTYTKICIKKVSYRN